MKQIRGQQKMTEKEVRREWFNKIIIVSSVSEKELPI